MVWDDSVFFPHRKCIVKRIPFFGYLNLETGFDLLFIYEEYKC